MILKEEYYDYIKGLKFDKGYCYKIIGQSKAGGGKIEYLTALLHNKSVIHLGCTDHMDCIEQKIKENIWMHKVLTEVSGNCIGLDINEKAVEFIKKRYAKKPFAENIHVADITSGYLRKHQIKADYLFMGEVLEHIDNPVSFLTQIVQSNYGCFKKMIITVPNMYSIDTKIYGWFNIEQINTDHRYWFSPITLWKVVDRAGLEVSSIELVSSSISNKRNLVNALKILSRLFFEWRPLNRKHIVLIADVRRK